MSYCRFSEGDVYLYESGYGGYVCAACHFFPPGEGGLCRPSAHMRTLGDALAHLEEHRAVGHAVPARAFVLLAEEIAERGAGYAPGWDGII